LIYDRLIRPILFRLPAETAHELGISALRIGLSSPRLQQFATGKFECEHPQPLSRFGLQFKNPLGLAAGFDKNGEVVNQLASLGFGFVEVGTVTLRPQKGNEKPRLFRLPADGALINRLGFNNQGAEKISARLERLDRKCVVGVNIGKNKDVPNEEAVENYLATFEIVHPVADYIAINVSSPNTPNLRELQRGENLDELLKALQERNRELSRAPNDVLPDESAPNLKPLLVKIAPDLDAAAVEQIVDICLRNRVSGIIATNTTVSRDGLKTRDPERFGAGGLSGRPLASRSNEIIRTIFRLAGRQLPIVGVGGVFTADDAFEKISAGASLIQAYTGFVYGGPGFAMEINDGLYAILQSRGFAHLDDAVGSES
jgi:dihydroorotate dehydrogenase